MEQDNVQNGSKRFPFSLPTMGCKGCEERKAIMGSGNWQVDAAIALIIIAGIILVYKVKIA